ncbi:thrombospondin N-terminal-like domain protein [Nostoc commune NIES-4072]|uniref:Thrombospondin N-terminal-like domain protein n=1 Tax=Nostoc commune NIES-4072 TaxID=2005467 RepID=A0A2R5FEJ0_NOSCO|nr:LamG domain-containing protein [Nostoc commune]BBD66269.1 thrombospondin N-terminal-like domain protein [Nostoc commune HK-02]GBG16405.1 thrombospondin N-terminal-like domain protein [Nostoc commune NIES-4072]
MQFIKRLGKQLGFVILIGSAVFSASSASAQVSELPKEETIFINTDLIINSAYLQSRFSGQSSLKLLSIGGIHRSPLNDANIDETEGRVIYDTFKNNYGNGYDVGGSTFEAGTSPFTNGTEIFGIFRNPRRELIFGIIPGVLPNPPALKLNESTNYGRCFFANCVLFHYGYAVKVQFRGTLNPSFYKSTFTIGDSNGTTSLSQRNSMVSPEIEPNPPGANFIPPEDTPDEFLVVFSQQTNPRQPNVAITNWTEFPIKRGQTPRLRFTNSESNFDPITVSNTRVLRSATKIPLEQLTAADLPPTPEVGFVEFSEANGIVLPGQTRDAVTLTDIPVTGTPILDRIASFNGTSDFIEIPNNENLNFGTGDLSISAWVKTTSTSGIEVILDKRVETTGPVQGYSLSNFNGNLLLQLADGVGNQFTNYVSNISISDGNWHHVAVTVDRDQPDGGRWYLDGVEVVGERFNPTRRGSLSNSKPLVIGRRSDSPSPGFFKGEIGRVRLDKRVLSSQEIQAIAANRP